MVLKIDYSRVKPQKVAYDVRRHKDFVTENTPSKWRHNFCLFLSPSLIKILVALLLVVEQIRITTWKH